MAATTSITSSGAIGDMFYGVVEVTLDSSYPTGGEVVDFASVLSWDVTAVVISLQSSSANGYVPQYDGTEILMYEAGAAAAPLDEVGNTTDLSAETITAFVVGV